MTTELISTAASFSKKTADKEVFACGLSEFLEKLFYSASGIIFEKCCCRAWMLNYLKGCSSTGALRVITGEVRQFMERLSETDRQILYLRMQKRPFAEIAQRLGFKTHSAVLKRVRKIGKAYERYMGEDFGFSEPKIVEREALL